MSRPHIKIQPLTLLIVVLSIFTALPASASSPEPQTQDAEVAETNYILSPSDELEIKITGEDDLAGTYKIDNAGNIAFPILGKVKIDGLTISQTEEKMQKLLEKDYFKTKVNVSAQVKKFHKMKAVIAGEVNKPGAYEFEEGRNMSLVELITFAGGPTEKACMNAATVIRAEANGKTTILKVMAGDIMEAREKDIILEPGDRVNIPSANVIVMGEVAKPGTYNFGDASKMTLLGAISQAGGFTRIAATNSVKIIRIDSLGNKHSIRVNVNSIYSGKEKDVLLEPNDIIVVPESWF